MAKTFASILLMVVCWGNSVSGDEISKSFELRYFSGDAAANGETAALRLRYKQPDADESQLREFTVVDGEQRFGEASADFRFASSVAAFALVLRRSRYTGELTLAAVEEFADGALGDDTGGYRAEFVELVRTAKEMLPK